jgi:hypothetical protein
MNFLENVIHLNPFSNLLVNVAGPKHAPHSPTLVTSFWEKVSSAFNISRGAGDTQLEILAKRLNNQNEPYFGLSVGLFDYLTLGIPLLIKLLIEAGMRKLLSVMSAPTSSKLIYGLATAGVVFLQILHFVNRITYVLPKLIFSLLVALFAMLTIIPMVHGISYLVGKKDVENALRVTDDSGKTLESLLNEGTCSYTALSSKMHKDGIVLGRVFQNLNHELDVKPDFRLSRASMDKQHSKMGSLFRLNVGNATALLEENNEELLEKYLSETPVSSATP